MSLYRWFSSASSKPYLPDPSNEETKKEDEVAKASTKVGEAMESQDRRKRPRSTYTFFSPELRASSHHMPDGTLKLFQTFPAM